MSSRWPWQQNYVQTPPSDYQVFLCLYCVRLLAIKKGLRLKYYCSLIEDQCNMTDEHKDRDDTWEKYYLDRLRIPWVLRHVNGSELSSPDCCLKTECFLNDSGWTAVGMVSVSLATNNKAKASHLSFFSMCVSVCVGSGMRFKGSTSSVGCSASCSVSRRSLHRLVGHDSSCKLLLGFFKASTSGTVERMYLWRGEIIFG